jgi:hypothetical protein
MSCCLMIGWACLSIGVSKTCGWGNAGQLSGFIGLDSTSLNHLNSAQLAQKRSLSGVEGLIKRT